MFCNCHLIFDVTISFYQPLVNPSKLLKNVFVQVHSRLEKRSSLVFLNSQFFFYLYRKGVVAILHCRLLKAVRYPESLFRIFRLDAHIVLK